MRRMTVFMSFAVLAVVFVAHLWAAPPVKTLEGYWIGIDNIDGGDQRRSFELQEDGTYSVVGRDTFLRLCDDTDRGVILADDARLIGRFFAASDSLSLTCLSNGAVLLLKARWELVSDSQIVEHVATQDDEPVQRLVLHRVSR